MKFLKTTLLFFFIVIAAIFVFQNFGTVKLSFLSWNTQIPLSLAITVIYILGAVSGGLLYSLLKKLTQKNKRIK